jgi:hypothetical protein
MVAESRTEVNTSDNLQARLRGYSEPPEGFGEIPTVRDRNENRRS